MDDPALRFYLPREEETVSFQEDVPRLLFSRQHSTQDSPDRRPDVRCGYGDEIEDLRHPKQGRTMAEVVPGEEEDDSLAMVFSSDTGAGRAHTPQRLNRTHTPLRMRPSGVVHTAAAPVQHASATRGGGESRRHPVGRRKQRRWENDNLLGVERFLRGRHAQDEGEAAHLTVSRQWRSSLAELVSDQNQSAAAVEVRESIRKGLQPAGRLAEREGGGPSSSGSRRYAGGKWEDAEERFLLVERRLRDVVVRALRNSAVLSFVSGLEALLKGFAKGQGVPSELPASLRSSLSARPTVELAAGRSADAGATLIVPVGDSPFHRLLLHALCQYGKLRSRSEETKHGRVVRVTIPKSGTARAVPDAPLTKFVLETRLRGADDGSEGADKRKGAASQASAGAAAARCGQEELAPMTTTVASVA